VTFVGRICPEKGVSVLLDAAAMPALREHRLRMLVVGSGQPAYVRALRERCGAPVRFVGQAPDPVSIYHASDVVVVPSVCEDSFPLVPLEALACGVPVVGSRTGGIPEALEGVPGHLVDPGCPEGLAAALTRLVTWRVDAPELGSSARSVAVERFSQERTFESLERVLCSVGLER
jgi:glycosyltransferase involved in cell wall biosynthesis